MRNHLVSCLSFCLGVLALASGCNSEGLVCTTQSECTQPNKPICALAVCRGCSNDQDCKDSWTQRQMEASAMSMATAAPLQVACDAGSGACKECLTDEHCAVARPGEPLKRKCDTATNTCVGCLDSVDCANNSTAKSAGLATCDPGLKSCIECTSNSDCAGRQLLPYCTSDKLCGGCLTNAECTVSGKTQCVSLMVSGVPRKQCAECASDAQCSDGKPACDTATGACTTCTGKPASFCETRNPLRPVCDTSGACSPCSKHEDCASGVCHRLGDFTPPTAAGTLMPGQCVPAAQVASVTPANIATELAGTKPYLKLQAGTYPELTVSREVVLVGATTLNHKTPSQPQTILSHLTLTGGRAVLYDVRVEAGTDGKALVACSGAAKLNARLARFTNRRAHRGIDASGACNEVRLSQTFFESDWEALNLKSTGALAYHVTNSLFVRSGSPGHVNAVVLGSTATGTFAFNTLYANQQGMACENSQTVSDSVITGVGTASVLCTEQRVTKTSMVADFTETQTGVFHPAAGIESMLVNMGQATTPALTFDFFGDPRPKGAAPDRGAEEIR